MSKSVTVKLATFDIHGCPKEIFKSHPLGDNSRKLTAKEREKWCLKDKLYGQRPFYSGYLSFAELGFLFSREWRDLFFLSKTLSKLPHLGLMWVIIVLFRHKPHGFRPFATPIFVKQAKTSKKNKFPEILRILGIIRRCSLVFWTFFFCPGEEEERRTSAERSPRWRVLRSVHVPWTPICFALEAGQNLPLSFGWWEPLGLICLARFPV